jgi:hypothetical protein
MLQTAKPIRRKAKQAPAPRCSDLLAVAASDFARVSKSEATRRAYQTDAADFAAWCRCHRLEPLPASVDTIATYLASLARSGLKASTITRRCAGVHLHGGSDVADVYAEYELRGLEPSALENMPAWSVILAAIDKAVKALSEKRITQIGREVFDAARRVKEEIN